MKSILILISCFFTNLLLADWSNHNTGINDHLTGVVFWGNNGLISGQKGVYYTTTGGVGSSSWIRFNISNNTTDSLLYNRTVFSHAISENAANGVNKAFVCGRDTINNKSVIFRFNLPSMTYNIVYNGDIGTSLNKMYSYSSYSSDRYYAVGDNGLIVNFSSFTSTVIPTGLSNNLNSISFVNSSFFNIGSNGTFIYGNRNSISGALTYTQIPTYGENYKDVVNIASSSGCAVGNSFYKWIGGVSAPLNYPNYDYGNLNANCVINYNNNLYVGTDHGIFKSTNTFSFLEWQPSSLVHTIKCIWRPYNSSIIYACGNNGTLLSTSDNGGLQKPYAHIGLGGGCKGGITAINGITGSSTNCQWYVDNVLSNTTCNGFVKTFSSIGQHTVQLNVSNGVNSYDTAFQIINIVDTPKIFKPYSLSKTVICKQEPIVITIDSSEFNVFYKLKKYGSFSDYGNSSGGNTSTITFSTIVLNQPGNYYIQAQSTIAECKNNFKDTIKISVENTKAKFHLGKLNVNQTESFSCFEKCTDAQNYSWSFTNVTSTINNSNPNPSITFTNVGASQIKLVCWSNHGCYDSITTKGPAVYSEPTIEDSCWTMVNNGVDPYWAGFYSPDISKLSPSKTGFYTCGHFNINSFASRYGDSIKPPFTVGAYMQKTNINGVAKWLCYSRQTSTFFRDQFNTIAEDANKNVYVGGKLSGPFYDNEGDSVDLVDYYNSSGFLLKLDSLGKLIWSMNISIPNTISFDKANNVILTTNSKINKVYLNGSPIYTVNTTSPTGNHSMIKINPSGSVIWCNNIDIDFTNGGKISTLQSDSSNNLYLLGAYDNNVKILSAITPSYTTIDRIPGIFGDYLFLAKFDSTGFYKWGIKSVVQSTIAQSIYDPTSMYVDENGDSYICGKNNSASIGGQQIFENTDSSITSFAGSSYFVAKINKDGICKWIQGTKNSQAGWGMEIYKLNNEISVLGQMLQPSSTTLTHTFSSANNNQIVLPISRADYFIANYDTLGNLKKITKNANNPDLCDTYSFAGMYRDSNGSYHIARNFRFYLGASNYNDFGTNIVSMNGVDGTITKYYGSCGEDYYTNNIVTSIHEKLLTNQAFLYPNPNNGIFNLETNEEANFKMSNILGQKIDEGALNKGKNQLNFNNLSKGVYYISIQNINQVLKFIKD